MSRDSVGIPLRCSLCVRQLLEKRVSNVHASLLVPSRLFSFSSTCPPTFPLTRGPPAVRRVARVWRERVAGRESRDRESIDSNAKHRLNGVSRFDSSRGSRRGNRSGGNGRLIVNTNADQRAAFSAIRYAQVHERTWCACAHARASFQRESAEREECALTAGRVEQGSFSREISKKISASRASLRRLTVSRCTRTVARSLRKQPAGSRCFRKLARSLGVTGRVGAAGVLRPSPKCIRCSQFASMATIPYKQNASCAHDVARRLALSRPPAAR